MNYTSVTALLEYLNLVAELSNRLRGTYYRRSLWVIMGHYGSLRVVVTQGMTACSRC